MRARCFSSKILPLLALFLALLIFVPYYGRGIELQCSDTDKGRDYRNRGSVTYGSSRNTDYCNQGDLIEWYCQPDKTKPPRWERVNCQGFDVNTKCLNGACVLSSNNGGGSGGGSCSIYANPSTINLDTRASGSGITVSYSGWGATRAVVNCGNGQYVYPNCGSGKCSTTCSYSTTGTFVVRATLRGGSGTPPSCGSAIIRVVRGSAPTDSDGDGVPDSQDKCPNTPSGTQVDANGCPQPDGAGSPNAILSCSPANPNVGDVVVCRGESNLYKIVSVSFDMNDGRGPRCTATNPPQICRTIYNNPGTYSVKYSVCGFVLVSGQNKYVCLSKTFTVNVRGTTPTPPPPNGTQPPQPPGGGLKIKLRAGYNMISSPSGDHYYYNLIRNSNCKVTKGPYWYDPLRNNWEIPSTIEDDKGYFLKVESACEINVASGDVPPPPPFFKFYSSQLYSGWNMISPGSTWRSWNDMKGNCVKTAPIYHWAGGPNYVTVSDTQRMDPSKGYWVFVSSSCTLS